MGRAVHESHQAVVEIDGQLAAIDVHGLDRVHARGIGSDREVKDVATGAGVWAAATAGHGDQPQACDERRHDAFRSVSSHGSFRIYPLRVDSSASPSSSAISCPRLRWRNQTSTTTPITKATAPPQPRYPS